MRKNEKLPHFSEHFCRNSGFSYKESFPHTAVLGLFTQFENNYEQMFRFNGDKTAHRLDNSPFLW